VACSVWRLASALAFEVDARLCVVNDETLSTYTGPTTTRNGHEESNSGCLMWLTTTHLLLLQS
jgi:hypothetical protein